MNRHENLVKARQQQLEINGKRRLKHVVVAHALRNPRLAPQVVNSALEQVNLWQQKKLCSIDYIDAWLALLNNPVKAAAVLEDPSAYAVQMRQNAPFVSYIRQTSLHAA